MKISSVVVVEEKMMRKEILYLRKTYTKTSLGWIQKISLLVIFTLSFSVLLTSCSLGLGNKISEDESNFSLGEQAKEYAYSYAKTFPRREAYTQEGQDAGTWIAEQLKAMKYEVEEQEVQPAQVRTKYQGEQIAHNYIVFLKGTGFTRGEEEAKDQQGLLDSNLELGDFSRTVMITSFYHSSMDENVEDLTLHQGMSQAASVGTLLSLAKYLKSHSYPYDIVLAFLAGTSDENTGAKVFFNSLSEDALQAIQSVIDIGNFYVGDKLYFHAGKSSVLPGKKVELRKELYYFVDLFSYNRIYLKFGVNILTNQNNHYISVPPLTDRALYREFSLNQGNYSVFDEKKIPVIFFDSGNYQYDPETQNFKESDLNVFQIQDGKITGTNLDNADFLEQNLSPRQFVERSQALQYIIDSYLQGMLNASNR